MDDRDGIGPGGKAFRVVLCSDNESELRNLQPLLETHGYQIPEVFTDGRSLVDWYKDNTGAVDLILMELIMPVLDGYAAFWELREIKPFPRVMFMSVENSSQVIKELVTSGAGDFITKPYNRIKLLDRIKVAVRKMPPSL